MNFDQELQYLNVRRKEVISAMLDNKIEKFFDGDHDAQLEKLNQHFDYVTDIHVDAESHPFVATIPQWYQFIGKGSYSLNIHLFAGVLDYSRFWRDAFISLYMTYDFPQRTLPLLTALLKRQDVFTNSICTHLAMKYLILSNENTTNQDQMHSDRLNLIGKMASSMAHEIRNPLTSIAGFLKLIRQNIINRSQPQLLKYIDVIDDEFDAINMQITGFLSFSRNKAFEEKKIEISLMDLINSTLFLLIPRLTSDNINFTFNEKHVCIIYAQKVSIQQVVSNIISNAIDALITVKRQRELMILCSEDNDYVYIHVVNNGPEISQEMRDKMFLPFATDKENGTGLGLAICKEIMAKNNGKIDFVSDSKETRFILSFKKQNKHMGEYI